LVVVLIFKTTTQGLVDEATAATTIAPLGVKDVCFVLFVITASPPKGGGRGYRLNVSFTISDIGNFWEAG